MDFQRVIVFIALSFTLLMLWQAWQKDYGQPQPAAVATNGGGEDLPAAPPQQGETAPTPEGAPAQPGLASAGRVAVETDLFRAEIDTYGGDIRQVDLVKYPVSADQPRHPVTLLTDQGSEIFVAQSGLLPAAGAPPESAPTHHSLYTAERSAYRLADSEKSLEVRLQWSGADGVIVNKIYTFQRGSYEIGLRHEVQNPSASPWRGYAYGQWLRSRPTDDGDAFVYTYTGGVVHGQELKYEKVKFDDMDEAPFSREVTGGWAAMIQHYFLGAWIPPAEGTHHYYGKAAGEGRYILGLVTPETSVAPGGTGHFDSRLYIGPKLQEQMAKVAPGLELTVDYGVLTFIAKPLYWLLEVVYDFIGNWGWSIVVLTILIKLAFYKLSETSYKSMAHMRKVQPRLMAIKERFGDDRQKMNEAMMKLYKEEKINPLGGCLPVLVQIPVFIALYWVLLESVELRQAPFVLWIEDLSSADPFFVLPIIMGVTMLIQHRLNPTPMDPIQAKVMLILPIVFTVFFAFFPAGLVLYWVVNNSLSIAQQWYITRWVVKAE